MRPTCENCNHEHASWFIYPFALTQWECECGCKEIKIEQFLARDKAMGTERDMEGCEKNSVRHEDHEPGYPEILGWEDD